MTDHKTAIGRRFRSGQWVNIARCGCGWEHADPYHFRAEDAARRHEELHRDRAAG